MKSDKLAEIHGNISPDHYDLAIKTNLLQKFWHWKRFKEISQIITPTGGIMGDIGCHSGLLTQKIAEILKPEKIYGIDISSRAITKAKQRIKKGFFQVGDAQKLPYPDIFFDTLFCIEVIEHVDFPQEVIREMYRVLKRGGYAIVMIPTDNLLFRVVWFLWNLRYPVWKHVHVQSFPGEVLEKLVSKFGFKIDSVKTLNFQMLKIIKITKP